AVQRLVRPSRQAGAIGALAESPPGDRQRLLELGRDGTVAVVLTRDAQLEAGGRTGIEREPEHRAAGVNRIRSAAPADAGAPFDVVETNVPEHAFVARPIR